MELLISIINSHVFRKYIVAPLAVVGFYQFFRGITTIIEKDISEHDLTGWMLVVYLVVTILGCICLVTAL